MKLKTKMSWTIAISVLLAVILLMGMLYAFAAFFVSGYNHVKLRELSVRLGEELERANIGNVEQLRAEMRRFAASHDKVGVELFGDDGTLLFSSEDRTEPYSLQDILARFDDQPSRMLLGEHAATVYGIEAGGEDYRVVFDVPGEELQQAQLFFYLNQWLSYPFFFAPLLLIVALPSAVAFFFVLFVTRRLVRLNEAMRQADLRESPVRLEDTSNDEIGMLTRLFNEMSERLNLQYVQTLQAEQARAKLVSSLSHDLRTPLSIIQGYAETLQRGSAHDPNTRIRHSTIIVQKSEYMNELLRQLFRLAELDDPSAVYRMESYSIQAILQAIIAEYVLVLKDLGMECQADLSEPQVRFTCDRDALGQLFRNLIDNAILYGRDGKYLGIRVNAMQESVEIVIEDRGKGIPEEEIERVFDRFYRVDKGRRGNGMGLGLALSQEIAAKHGGKITVRSVPNASTLFTVSLPLAIKT